MKKIRLTQGKVSLVDDEDFKMLNKFKWYLVDQGKTYNAGRKAPAIKGKRGVIRMHHAILGFPSNGFVTDHADGDGLNNQRYNLSFVTHRQNTHNRKNQIKQKSSQYPGVQWKGGKNEWRTRIYIDGKIKEIGSFEKEIDAFNAYKLEVEALGDMVLENI